MIVYDTLNFFVLVPKVDMYAGEGIDTEVRGGDESKGIKRGNTAQLEQPRSNRVMSCSQICCPVNPERELGACRGSFGGLHNGESDEETRVNDHLHVQQYYITVVHINYS